jgi:hypothetical protein
MVAARRRRIGVLDRSRDVARAGDHEVLFARVRRAADRAAGMVCATVVVGHRDLRGLVRASW